MKTPLSTLLFGATIALASPHGNAAGFKLIDVPDAGHPDLTVGVWYPSNMAVPENPNTRYGLSVAMDAPLGEANGALIVISHGYGGWYAGHADTAIALADAGYIIAAPSHTGNTWSDMSSTLVEWSLDRPRHVSRLIDHVLQRDSLASDIDPQKIGFYGFSAGGYTALGLIGGVPDMKHAEQHCNQYPDEFLCSEGWLDAMIEADMDKLPASAWGADKRIQSAVIAAPAWAFAYPSASLSQVTADIQLWSAEFDHSVPTATNAAFLAEQLPTSPEMHWIEGANHFAFLVTPCREAFKKEDPVEYKFVCADADGFDRLAFHESMHKEMVRFYDASFGFSERSD